MATSNEGQTWTVHSFKVALAKALTEIHKAQRLSNDTQYALSSFGLPMPETSGDGSPTFNIPEESGDTFIARGVKLSDLSDAARAKREAEQVATLRQEAYQYLRSQVRYGEYTDEQVIRHLGSLGFPMPKQVTSVSVQVPKANGSHDSYRFTVPGIVTEDEVKAKFADQAQEPSDNATIRAAFPNAEGLTSGEVICSVSTTTEWARSLD